MKWWRLLFIVLAGLLALGVAYVFCISCQFFGYMPTSSVEEIFANPSSKPVHLTGIGTETFGNDIDLCVSISKAAFVKPTDNPSEILFDFPNQIVEIKDNFEKSFRFAIDGWRSSVADVAWSDVGPFTKCANVASLNRGKHVAHVEYNDLDNVQYSYTWVFEVKSDGIVPEMKAIP